MTEKFKILGRYIKDMSSETKDPETYIFVKENISKYQLDINHKPCNFVELFPRLKEK